tara:strand:+ start:231 stop:701 length:471 start_codon:yes stop_codon:yes gene_type:complete
MLTNIQRLNFYLRIISFWKIPLLFYCRPKIVLLTDSKVQFKIKLKRRVKNHLGSMYLGALAVGADLASGYFAFHYLQKYKKSISLIFKDFHADFYKRSMGDVLFTCEMGKEIKDLIDKSLVTDKRLNLPVTVTATVPSISDEVVAKFTLTLSVKTK